jgi:hypothetical protein
MGSAKQSTFLFGIRQEIDSLTGTLRPEGFEQKFKNSILDLPHRDVSTLLDILRAERSALSGGAHPNQRKFGRQLESELHAMGLLSTPTQWATLSVHEADVLIKKLIAVKKQGRSVPAEAPQIDPRTTAEATRKAGEDARQRMIAGAREDAEHRRAEPFKAEPQEPAGDLFADLLGDLAPTAPVAKLNVFELLTERPAEEVRGMPDTAKSNVVNMFEFQRKAV